MSYKQILKLARKTLTVTIAGVFLFSSTLGWAKEEKLFLTGMRNNAFSSSPAAQKDKLAPSTKLDIGEFRQSLTVAAICKYIEHNGNLNDKSRLEHILARLEAGKNSNITVLPNEIIIEIPSEGLAIRYFDPAKANVITPFSDISKLSTKVISPRLNRQILHLARALPPAKLESIIDPKDIETGEELSRIIDRTLLADTPKVEDYTIYSRIIVTACSIFSGYETFLNEEIGLDIKRQFDELGNMLKSGNLIWSEESFIHFKQLISKIPTIENPNEDLFVEVFAGFTIDQMQVLSTTGYPHSLHLQLTKGCGNQCLLCGVPKQKGTMQHMPFPLVVKILKKISEARSKEEGARLYLQPYLASDPLHYHDSVINATIAEVVECANKKGFKTAIITHGIGGKKASDVEKILSRIKTEFVISVHTYHRDVLAYALAKWNGRSSEETTAEIAGRRNAIIQRYVDRFVNLIKAAKESGQKFKVRPFKRMDNRTKEILEPYEYAYFIIHEIESIQEEAWDRIYRSGIVNRVDCYDYSVGWQGEAAKLLRSLKVSEADIEKLQRFSSDLVQTHGGSSIGVNPDGSMTMQGDEKGYRLRNTVEIFNDPLSDRFREFLQYLRVILQMDYKEDESLLREICLRLNKPHHRINFAPIAHIDRFDKTAQEFIARKMGTAFKGKAPSVDEIRNNIAYVQTSPFTERFYRIIVNFFILKNDFGPLLDNLTDDNLRIIYDRIKYFPFPLEGDYSLTVVTKENEVWWWNYNLVQKEDPLYHSDNCTVYREFPAPLRAFSSRRIDTLQEGLTVIRTDKSKLIEKFRHIIDNNKMLIATLFNDNRPFLIRVPIEVMENMGVEKEGFLSALQSMPNCYFELYYMSGIDKASEDVYRKFGLNKKPLPQGFVKTRENTITLFPSLKGEELTPGDILGRLGEVRLDPTKTILSPIGLQHDLSGLVRSTILGLRLMTISRQHKQSGNIDYGFISDTVDQLKELCESQGVSEFNLNNQDIIDIAIGDINDTIKTLKKLIKLLPIKPITEEELKQIYEYTTQVLTSA